jgi:hypothetical protein
MARPARVRMRRRKPCVLARRRLFGWKVRLLTWISVGCGASSTSGRRRGARVGLAVADATAIGKPMESQDPARPAPVGPWACERGRRHARSTIRERRNGGQTGAGGRATHGRNHRSSNLAARLQADTPERRKICRRFDCLCRRRHCRFSTLTILATFCTGCGQTCGQQGIVSRAPFRGHRWGPRRRHRTDHDASSSARPVEPTSQQVHRRDQG